jgi:hypothetical protein
MQYHMCLRDGLPIGAVIEGVCRHLINDRMDITGARWRLDCTHRSRRAPAAARRGRHIQAVAAHLIKKQGQCYFDC